MLRNLKKMCFLKNVSQKSYGTNTIVVKNHKNVTKWVAMARHGPILLQNESYSLQEYFPTH